MFKKAKKIKQEKNIFLISIDYGMSIEKMLELGEYNSLNSKITSKHFPTSRTGKMETEIILIHFNRSISSKEALKEMDKMGLRAAEPHELLAFGVKYPDVQCQFPIVALGLVWRGPDDSRNVVCLGGVGAKRNTRLYWCEGDWGDYWRFAAVRK